MRAPMVPAPRTATLLIFLCMSARGLSECGDGGASGEPFPAVFILTSTLDGEGGAAVSGMGQLQGVGPKNRAGARHSFYASARQRKSRAFASESGRRKKSI